MTVQDDERERELVRLFNLTWDAAHQRTGVDALLPLVVEGQPYEFEVEVKSTTGSTVSTARDVGMEHIEKWRRKIFVVGFYSRERGRPELGRCLCLTPTDMEPWIASVEAKIMIDFKLAERASRKLDLIDLFDVCGRRENYGMEDAVRLHKQQWNKQQYEGALDIEVAGVRRISQQQMLRILQLRAVYIGERGATLNNPHVTKSHLDTFIRTNREVFGDWADAVKRIAREFALNNPGHIALLRDA